MVIKGTSTLLTVVVLAVVAVTVSACSRSPEVKFYTLSKTAIPASGSGSDLAVAVGPAELPRALGRNQIVTRKGGTQINVDQYNVWAASLETELLRVVGDNLASGLGSDRVLVYPGDGPFDLDYRVLLHVLQFDGVLGEDVTMRARWTIMHDGEVAAVGMFEDTQAVTDGSYDALVAAHSAAVGELSEIIVARLVSLGKPAES